MSDQRTVSWEGHEEAAMTDRQFNVWMTLIILAMFAILGAFLVFMVIPQEKATWECVERCAPLDSVTSSWALGSKCACIDKGASRP